MRKYIIGGLVGVALTLSTTAFGDTISKIGKTIEGEYAVKVDGSALSQKAIAVDGTTYVPLRTAADTFGYDADFQDKTVILTERSVVVENGSPTETPIDNANAEKTIARLQIEINYLQSVIDDLISKGKGELPAVQEYRDQIKADQAQIDALNAQLGQ